jgi:predicted dehydrogenase
VARRRGRLPRLLVPGIRDIRGYQAMYRDFVRAIGNGGQPEMGLERAIEDQRLMEQILASASQRRDVVRAVS